jgi:3-oxo-5alpha-steroid 4-dehydrogenase
VPEKWDYEADVVIVGFGAGGSAAAIEAHDAGAKVLILEKLDEQGGSIRRCGGGILGAGTAVQKALGVEDSPDRLYEYLMLCWGKSNVDLERIRILADNAGKNVDWVIQDLGADMPWELSESGIIPGLNSTCEMFAAPPGYVPQAPRSHWMNPAPGYEEKGWRDGMVGGTGLFKPFDEAIKKRQIESLLETPLVGLVADANREVLGVKAESGGTILYIKARRGVFLGTGGWRNNVKMLRDYHPGGQEAIEGAFVTEPNPSIYSLHEDGSGVIAAQAIGADLANMGQLDSTMFHCDGGLRINNKAQVIDVYGQVIPRLYASGCISGGTFGEYYPGCGTYVTVAVCFGRIGGQNVAAEEPWV